jgi:hypothetical protein
MRNFAGTGLIPATYLICITQADPQKISQYRSTQLPVMASFAGPTSSPLIINHQNTANENYNTLRNMSITGLSPDYDLRLQAIHQNNLLYETI